MEGKVEGIKIPIEIENMEQLDRVVEKAKELVSMNNKNKFAEKYENEIEKLLYKELPDLLHKILSIRLMPSMYSRTILDEEIETIKKITNAECESTLVYIDKLI